MKCVNDHELKAAILRFCRRTADRSSDQGRRSHSAIGSANWPRREKKRRMNDEDVRHDDLEFEPSLEPKSSKAWINLLEESEKAFEDWNDHCDRIDKQYGNLERLASVTRDREFAMFWANIEVIKPSIYAKPPTPVVTAKFKDRRPVYQQAAELMERCCVVAFDLANINDIMLQIRDDVAIAGRGVAWCRYESGKE